MTDFRAEQSRMLDQGHRQICAACAVTAAHEWCLRDALSVEDAHHHGKLADGRPDCELSAVSSILGALRAVGQATEATWPFNTPAWPGTAPAASQLAANRIQTPRWRILPAHAPADVRRELATSAVILSLRHVPDAWDNGALVHAAPGTETNGRHAVLAVGDGTYQGHETVMIRNSWGAGWGIDGYGYVTDTYLTAFLAVAYVIDRDPAMESAAA